MNFKGTKKLYIIKTCEQILYFNSIKHHIQFQYNCRGWGLGVGHYPQKISSGWPCSICVLPCQILTKLCDFPYPISCLIQNSIPNFKPSLALHSQNMMRAVTEVTRAHLYCESYKTMNTTNIKECYCIC